MAISRSVCGNNVAAVVLAVVALGLSWPVIADGTLPQDSQAAQGRKVFVTHCAHCHGQDGQGYIGPAVIGAGALAQYDTAQRLYEYTTATMPQTNPGGLTQQQYIQVIDYLLVANDIIDPDTKLKRSELGEISLH